MGYLDREETPKALRGWADLFIGKPIKHDSRRIIAGWRWDGRSPTIVLMYAPKGSGTKDIPLNIWRQIQSSLITEFAVA